MRSIDPTIEAHIGGQGLGITVPYEDFLDDDDEIREVMMKTAQVACSEDHFQLRPKTFYLNITTLHMNSIRVNSHQTKRSLKKVRNALGMYLPSQRASNPNNSRNEEQDENMSNGNENGQMNSAQGHGAPSTDREETVDKRNDVAHNGSEPNDRRCFVQNGSSFVQNGSSFVQNDGSLLQNNHSVVESQSIDTGNTTISTPRQAVIPKRLKTLDDCVEMWLNGKFRGVYIRELRRADTRKKLKPPIPNSTWNSEKHSVKRMCEMVQLVSHFLPNKLLDPSLPRTRWNDAIDACYAKIDPSKGRKIPFYKIRKKAAELNLEMKDSLN